MESLAVRYRPKDWEEVCSQNSIIKILSRQVELREFSNCFLFCGPSGCGKTTVARIFANKINNNIGNAIEIDAASNNGVDKIRDIVSTANQRSVDSEYKVLILDEPTSALDPVAEYEIYQHFDQMVEDKTSIYISHRMSSCRFCDNILVFDEGEIVESGSHEELMKEGGLYSQLWNAQAQYYA